MLSTQYWWVFALLLATWAPQMRAQEAKDPIFWLARANDEMTLRMIGAAPFHMTVSFSALPGLELLPKGKSQILTGEGVYEETWLTPHEWRREVTLGGYHAVESQVRGIRKMQATSDYVPGRVLMLLNALLNPISRYELSPEKHDHATHWKMEQLSADGHALVRISRKLQAESLSKAGEAYVFLPSGMLLQSNSNDILTTFDNDKVFAGKLVARTISVSAGTDRELLNAKVTVEAVGQIDAASLDLPGEAADPALTLRPLQANEVRPPEPPSARTTMNAGPGPSTQDQGLYIHIYIDRRGHVRDAEVITLLKKGNDNPIDAAQRQIDDVREWQ